MERKKRSFVERFRLLRKLGDKCVYCGCNHNFLLELDHKTPLSRGGSDDEKNLQITCILCNRLKSNMTNLEFKKYLKMLRDLKDLGKVWMKRFSFEFGLNVENDISGNIVNMKKEKNGTK